MALSAWYVIFFLFMQIVANHVVPGLFNSDSFKPHLIYELPSMFGKLEVRRVENILKVLCLFYKN